MQTLVSLTDTSSPAKWSMLRFSFWCLRPFTRTSLNHQPEAQHPKSSAIHKLAGRLPHLLRVWPPRRLCPRTGRSGTGSLAQPSGSFIGHPAEKITLDRVRIQAPDLVRSRAPDISLVELCSKL